MPFFFLFILVLGICGLIIIIDNEFTGDPVRSAIISFLFIILADLGSHNIIVLVQPAKHNENSSGGKVGPEEENYYNGRAAQPIVLSSSSASLAVKMKTISRALPPAHHTALTSMSWLLTVNPCQR